MKRCCTFTHGTVAHAFRPWVSPERLVAFFAIKIGHREIEAARPNVAGDFKQLAGPSAPNSVSDLRIDAQTVTVARCV